MARKLTEVQEAGAWLMRVVRTLADAAPVEIGRTKAVALSVEDVDRIKREGQAWAQVLGKDVPAPQADGDTK